jgi:hypothetical protein
MIHIDEQKYNAIRNQIRNVFLRHFWKQENWAYFIDAGRSFYVPPTVAELYAGVDGNNKPSEAAFAFVLDSMRKIGTIQISSDHSPSRLPYAQRRVIPTFKEIARLTGASKFGIVETGKEFYFEGDENRHLTQRVNKGTQEAA